MVPIEGANIRATTLKKTTTGLSLDLPPALLLPLLLHLLHDLHFHFFNTTTITAFPLFYRYFQISRFLGPLKKYFMQFF